MFSSGFNSILFFSFFPSHIFVAFVFWQNERRKVKSWQLFQKRVQQEDRRFSRQRRFVNSLCSAERRLATYLTFMACLTRKVAFTPHVTDVGRLVNLNRGLFYTFDKIKNYSNFSPIKFVSTNKFINLYNSFVFIKWHKDREGLGAIQDDRVDASRQTKGSLAEGLSLPYMHTGITFYSEADFISGGSRENEMERTWTDKRKSC